MILIFTEAVFINEVSHAKKEEVLRVGILKMAKTRIQYNIWLKNISVKNATTDTVKQPCFVISWESVVFLSTFLRFCYQKKAYIFLISLSFSYLKFLIEDCSGRSTQVP